MYKIPVKIDGIERRKKSTGLLHIVAGFFLIANGGTYMRQMNFENIAYVIPFYIIAVISLAYGFFRYRIDPSAQYNHWVRMGQFLSFSALTLIFLSFSKAPQIIGLSLWAIITLFLMFTERKVFHDAQLELKMEGIYIPGYLKTHVVPWAIIENLVVRTDYVTILRRGQKYVQLEILNDVSQREIEAINQFSQQQIHQFAQVLVQS